MPVLSARIKKRLLAYSFTFFLLWPLISLISVTLDAEKAKGIAVPISIAFLAASGGTLLLLPDFMVVGAVLMVLCLVFFYCLDSRRWLQPLDYRGSLVLEPVLLFGSVFFALLLHYPALLGHPILTPLRSLPVWLATLGLGVLVTIFSALYASRGSRLKVSLTILLTGFLLVSYGEIRSSHRGGNQVVKQTNNLVLLGLDSLSYNDDLSVILNWAVAHRGTEYQLAVTPGLLTNSVWTSLIAMQPVAHHGVFHSFQSSHLQEGETLVSLAHRAGYRTISIFPDQFSCWIACETDFDVHRDGPIGWRHIATASVENKSILLPLLRPLLPKIPFSCVPRNHLGTYNYDLEKGLDSVFLNQGKTFVASHHTYLHSTRYPKYSELSKGEILRVIQAQAGWINDKTFDWQYADSPETPIPLRKWKISHLQKSLIASLERTGYLRNGGRLVLFSDHGNRINLDDTNFTNPNYHHVLFVTFGLPVYSDPESPVSLLDIPGIIGLKDYRQAPPVVEFTLSAPEEWQKLMGSAKLDWDGPVHLDRHTLSGIFQRLKSYRPYMTLSAQ
jgi:hypothetical protein